jgi:hypothetical protein
LAVKLSDGRRDIGGRAAVKLLEQRPTVEDEDGKDPHHFTSHPTVEDEDGKDHVAASSKYLPRRVPIRVAGISLKALVSIVASLQF